MIRVCVAYVLLGAGLWSLPLLTVLQVESAAVVAFVAFFVAGWGACRSFRQGQSFVAVLGSQEAAVTIPLGMLLIAPLWAPNCTLGQGLLFYLLFPGVTVVFAVGGAYCLTGLSLTRPFAWLAGVGVVISLAGPLYDLGFHPQFYTYNHVFGGVLGPIYDEQLAVRDGLFVFRGLTLLWAGAAVMAGRVLRGRGGSAGLFVFLVAIGGIYAFAAPLGLNTTPGTLRSALGGHHQTEHFDLYYDPSHLDSAAVAALAADHEAHYEGIRRRLNGRQAAGDRRIQSYLYPSPEVKARLTGARTTSVAPVWLGQPQVHLLERRAEASLGHELAHVLARPYGLPLLKASWSPGLVEGWAVALEGPDAGPTSHDLVSTAWTADSVAALDQQAQALTQRFSPWGFWTGRGAVSYAAMGSFVEYLLSTYGPAPLKRVYARANFAEVYGRPVSELTDEWAAYVRGRSMVSAGSYRVVSGQFARPSLFEAKCPHYVPPARRHLQAAREAGREQDTARARHELQEAIADAPRYAAAHARLAALRLADGEAAAVRRQLDTLSLPPLPPQLSRLLGDAEARLGAPRRAREHYEQALKQMPRSAPEGRVRLMLRRAVAHRPAVVRVLSGPDSAHVQAHRLRQVDGPAAAVWEAIRWADANRFAAANAAWGRVQPGPLAEWPRAWRQTWGVQRLAWHAEAAARSGRSAEAQHLAAQGAQMARRLGADSWARSFERWTGRGDLWAGTRGRRSPALSPQGEPPGACWVHQTPSPSSADRSIGLSSPT